MKRDGFIIHEKTLKQMSRLEPEDVKYLMECLTDYYYTGAMNIDEVEEHSIAVAVILDDAIERMDADADAYQKSIEQRRQAAQKRWQKDAEGMREYATACDRIPPQREAYAKNADSVSVSDSVSVIKENSPTESKRKVFKRPTVEEVREYCLERHNGIDPESFVAFYDSKGWKIGNSPMKNWKSAVITWEKRNRENPPNKVNRFQNFPINEANRSLAAQILQMR